MRRSIDIRFILFAAILIGLSLWANFDPFIE
jgi:hypothetical protein